MVTVKQRTERLEELRQRGIRLPLLQAADLERSTPPPAIADSIWLAYLYDRPTERSFEGNLMALEPLQAAWDESHRIVEGQLKLHREIDANAAARQDARDAAATARRLAKEAQLKQMLQERYLRMPGTTESDFDQAYPEILADHRRREMSAPEDLATARARVATRPNL